MTAEESGGQVVRVRTRRSVPPPPQRPNGGPYRYELIDGAGRWRMYADELSLLVAELIEGYANLPDDTARTEARTHALVVPQIFAQADVNEQVGLDGCTPEQKELLTGRRDQPPAITEWSAPVPLVLITGFYRPLGRLPRPTATPPGEIVWLDSSTDESYLHGLRATGAVRLAQVRD